MNIDYTVAGLELINEEGFEFINEEGVMSEVTGSLIDETVHALWKKGPLKRETIRLELLLILAAHEFIDVDDEDVSISARGMDYIMGLDLRESESRDFLKWWVEE